MDIKLASLHINNVNNIETRYEYLDNADINEVVEYRGKRKMLRDTLLDLTIRTTPLLIGVE